VCSVLDGLRTLDATLAVHVAAESERSVRLRDYSVVAELGFGASSDGAIALPIAYS